MDEDQSHRGRQKVVVVTGASRGIGAGIVAGFRRQGASVVAVSRTIASGADPDTLAVAGDLADPATAHRVVEAALERFGRVDTLVNNAGVFLPKAFTDYSEDDLASVVAVNLTGTFRMSQRAAAPMLAQGSGHIVTITTSLVDQPMTAVPSVLASLTKGGLDAMTRALAMEHATRGIRVNAVSPGIIDTPMHAAAAHDALATLQPLGRLGTVEDVVQAVLYLDGAAFVTGETLHVDGGAAAGRW